MTRFHFASTKDPHMLYLAQYRITDPFFFLETKEKQYIFLSSVDIDAFKEESRGRIEAVDVGPLKKEAAQMEGEVLGNLTKCIFKKYEVYEEVVVPTTFPISLADSLRAENIRLIVGTDWCPEREQKTSEEIGFIKNNFEHTKKAFQFVERVLKESKIVGDVLMYKDTVLTSEYLKREVSKLLLEYDLENTEGLIISCGKHAAMPHHSGTGPIRPHQTIIVDIFPQSTKNHYFADMTRTYVKGIANDDVVQMYTAVQEAQSVSFEGLRPGVTGKDAYEISARSIKNAGFDVGEKGYMHSLGHGLGVAVHESPSLSTHSKTQLQVGHVVTVEPGLYYEDLGGVRIEDTIVITRDGYENLTNYPQNWLIV